jgi:hypothetical protein
MSVEVEPDKDETPVGVALPEEGTGVRASRRGRERKRRLTRRIAFTTALVLLVVAVPALGYIGYHAVFTTTAGRKVDPENDPTKPSYEANVTPTPVALVAHTGSDGTLLDLEVLVLANGERGGTMISIPGTTALNALQPNTSFADLYAKQGLPAVNQALADLLGVSFDEADMVTHDRLTELFAPVAPITVDNPDDIVSVDARGHKTVLFHSGKLSLSADQAADYVETRNPGETDLNRMARLQALTTAWLTAVGASKNPNAVPGETTRGLGRYLRALASGPFTATTAPVNKNGNGFVADTAQLNDLVTKTVPLPTSSHPGARVRVRLLDGVRADQLWALAASKIVPLGTEITIVGNADNFNYDTTQVVYYDDAMAPAAAKVQAGLGVGTTVKNDTPFDAADLTIIIGKDFVNKYGTGG